MSAVSDGSPPAMEACHSCSSAVRRATRLIVYCTDVNDLQLARQDALQSYQKLDATRLRSPSPLRRAACGAADSTLALLKSATATCGNMSCTPACPSEAKTLLANAVCCATRDIHCSIL
ncbi:hypothetical protein AcW2_004757 [Taiwanofungus camphoratus]|nr:hypothetical protein AcW2_004757 [Antrodia cinnamomea]